MRETKNKTKKDRYKDKKPTKPGEGEFTKALKKKDITHYFNFRYPKGQTYVERMNRTLQEEFVMYYEDYELEDIHEFNKKMLQYMLWYNTERPHHSLNKSEFSQTGMTYTFYCISRSTYFILLLLQINILKNYMEVIHW